MTTCPACKRHILVVDDDALVCETVTMILQIDGHVVDSASSGAQALALFQPGSQSFRPLSGQDSASVSLTGDFTNVSAGSYNLSVSIGGTHGANSGAVGSARPAGEKMSPSDQWTLPGANTPNVGAAGPGGAPTPGR